MIPLRDDNPVHRTPILTYAIFAANVAAWAWQLSTGLEESVLRGGAIPYELLTFTDVDYVALVPPPLTALTSMFLHGGWMHIASNMLFLWVFGNNVEDALGRGRFLVFYVASGIAAALAQTLTQAMTGDMGTPMVGASGAIAGVLAAYLALFPHARVETLVIVVIYPLRTVLPAWALIGFWIATQVLSVLFGSGQSGVAFMAHIGGFVAGFVLVRAMGRSDAWRARQVRW